MTETTTYTQAGGCAWCSANHAGLCPLVLEIEYWDSGRIRRVKFVPPDERTRLGLEVKIRPYGGDADYYTSEAGGDV